MEPVGGPVEETWLADIPAAGHPPVPPLAPGVAPPGPGRGRGGLVGWVLAGALGLALVAVVIVLWPSGGDEGPRREPAVAASPSADASSGSSPPVGDPTPDPGRRFWVDTYDDAAGYASPGASERSGTLREGTNFVFCKRWGARRDRDGGAVFNHWWLFTVLDEPRGGRGWVSALFLTRGGNDEAADNSGRDIPVC
ncbi:hypothetical protein [Spirillospora sp. CA-294931]|uniref:hypothetical protein n=1 Tax=Spirillospora sp. CA-294931 TaxID=3240042 RepID=UPI003D9363E6